MQSAFLNFSFLGVLKIFAIIALVIYVVFAFVVVRQVQLMVDTLEVGFERPIKILVAVHFVFAILVLVLAFFVL